MKVFKHLLLFIICFIASLFLCMYIFDDILIRVTLSEYVYLIARIFLSIVLYFLVISISNKKVSKRQINIIAVLYIICIISVTFFKGMYGGGVSGLNFNPLQIIRDFKLSSNTTLLIIGNVFAYVPIGIYIKYVSRIKNIKLYCYFILYCLIIESIQYIFKLGSFDINDIIMNSAGFIIGVIIYMNIIKISGDLK